MKKILLTVAQMRALDDYVISRDHAAIKLMGNAGKALANELEQFEKIAIVCGPGNNGGDGYAAIFALQERGCLDNKSISIFYTKPPKSDESKFFFEKITHKNVHIAEFERTCLDPECDVIVDCLLGTGFCGEPKGAIRNSIEAINSTISPARCMVATKKINSKKWQRRPKIISMDINSGVNGDTGDGEIAVKSDLTLSIGYLKLGMTKPCFKNWANEVKNVNIGYTEKDIVEAGILS